MGWNTKQIPDLSGKVAIVTGANTGIGRITALELARKGAHVILASRSAEKTVPVVEEIKKATNNDKVEFLQLDLSSLSSVEAFTKAFLQKSLPLHILVDNAGIMATPFGLTQDGIESQFGTNHIGHFLLTTRLLPVIEQSAPSRIVVLSSMAHTMAPEGGILFDKINDQNSYAPWKAYGQSKLANILFAKALAKRVADKKVYVNAVHPGYVATDLQRHLSSIYGFFGKIFGAIGHSLFAMKPEKGALTSLYVATSPEIEEKNYRGEYFVPIAKHSIPSAYATNADLAEKLWEFSEKLVNEKLQSQPQSQQSNNEEKKEDTTLSE